MSYDVRVLLEKKMKWQLCSLSRFARWHKCPVSLRKQANEHAGHLHRVRAVQRIYLGHRRYLGPQ